MNCMCHHGTAPTEVISWSFHCPLHPTTYSTSANFTFKES